MGILRPLPSYGVPSTPPLTTDTFTCQKRGAPLLSQTKPAATHSQRLYSPSGSYHGHNECPLEMSCPTSRLSSRSAHGDYVRDSCASDSCSEPNASRLRIRPRRWRTKWLRRRPLSRRMTLFLARYYERKYPVPSYTKMIRFALPCIICFYVHCTFFSLSSPSAWLSTI